MGSTGWRWPSVLAHRCGGVLAPENTLAGLNASVGICQGVEFDVMLSRSQTPFVIHDDTLERTTDGHGAVCDADDALLDSLDAGSWFDPCFAGERLPRLAHLARRCIALGLAANVEIKPAPGHDEVTAELVAKHVAIFWRNASSPPLLSSFSELALEVAARVAPELPRGLLVEDMPHDWALRCRRVGAISLHVATEHINRERARSVVDAGLRLVVYTENDPDRARQLRAWGVDCVITDRPDIVHAQPD